MNRIEFMSRLSFLLSDLPENERTEAIQYYEDYLNDAGVENEEEVLKGLGTPEELAASIREGLKEDSGQQGEFSENGFYEKSAKLENEVTRGGGSADSRYGQRSTAYGSQQRGQQTAYRSHDHSSDTAGSSNNPGGRYRGRERRKGMSGGMIALIVILCIVVAPAVIPVAVTVAVVIAVLAFVAVLLAGIFLFTGIICIVAGVLALAGAIVKLFLYPAGAILVIGISLLAIGVGILLTIAVGNIISHVFPKVFNGIVNWVGGLFHRKGGNAA